MIEDIIFRSFYANANKRVEIKNNLRKVEKIEKAKSAAREEEHAAKENSITIARSMDRIRFITIPPCFSKIVARLYHFFDGNERDRMIKIQKKTCGFVQKK